jgi:hypothetical protein
LKAWNDRIHRELSRRIVGEPGVGHMNSHRMRAWFGLSDRRIDVASFHRVGTRHGGKSQKWWDRQFRSKFAP